MYYKHKLCTMKQIDKKDLQEIFDRYLKGEKILNISLDFEVHPDTIYKKLRKNNFKTLPQEITKRKYKLQDSFFEKIDAEEKAYVLGLLYADGTYSKSNNLISLELQERDKEILDKITNILQPEKPLLFVKKRKESHQNHYRLCICSKPICTQLLKIGFESNKSFKIRFPDIQKHLIHHFIRGFFDGDGCISVYLIKNKYQTCSFSITSNENFLKELQIILINELQLSKTKLCRDNRGNNINTLVYGGKQNCLKIRDWLYKDATIYLKRKHDKFYSI